MISKNKFNINPLLHGRNFCVKSLSLFGTARLFSNLRRATPFYSLIKLRFDHFAGKIGHKVVNSYVRVTSSSFSPYTTKNDLPINAAKILISFPIFWLTLSTAMVNNIFKHGVEVTMPIYTWGMLDRYFIRVERENFGSEPGLFGNIISYNETITVKKFIEQLFTDEFLYFCLLGTDFERLVAIRKDSAGNEYYHIDNDLLKALNSRLRPFDCIAYSYDFMVAVSSFYSDYSSKFYNKLVVSSKMPDRRINTEVGLHCLRNHENDLCYIYHKSVDPKFDNQFFFNTFLILAVLFKVEYYAATDDTLSDLRSYGDGIPGNNELYLDITSIKTIDIFKTLFSAGLRTHVVEEGNKVPATPLRALEVPFGGIRQFSTFANPSIRTLDSRRQVPVGSVFYSVPVCSFGYSKVDLGNGRFIIVDTS